ncbi:RibD domain-containing protein [Haloactinospora alba]|uniref:RibD domain-containing protein n=1 Tax=Haloactinospora alba TaxID=405555 RepID=A0A543NMT6_9ACTN|nr:RibD domain-containing protein [Haloactinospora alba]
MQANIAAIQTLRLLQQQQRPASAQEQQALARWSGCRAVPAVFDASDTRLAAERTEGDIQMSGSATTARWLFANGLLDELRLLVHPIVVGRGQRLFENSPTQPLKLVSSETFATGVLNLAYTPEAADTA